MPREEVGAARGVADVVLVAIRPNLVVEDRDKILTIYLSGPVTKQGKLTKNQNSFIVHWGSKYRTNLVFKGAKHVP